MLKKSSMWSIILISVIIAFIATGCAKKQMVKEEAAAKPAVQAKKEEAKPVVPAAAEKPKEQAKVAAPSASAPAKEEAKPAPAAAVLNLRDLTIWFAFDDYNLSSHAKENLEKIASWMSKTSDLKIQVQGNTCDIGTEEYNLALGEKRATSAKKYLEGLGVNPAKMSTTSFGPEKPLVPNADEANRSKNRRDEFVVIK